MIKTPPPIDGLTFGPRLGAGSIGTVFAANDLEHGPVAVKVVRPSHPAAAQVIERTLQEGALCYALDHPNIVRVFRFGPTPGGGAFLVMERLDGETLSERLARVRLLPALEATSLLRQAARGLARLHARGIVHRDVKPENLYLCRRGAVPDQVKLLDLGIAHVPAAEAGRAVDTPRGMIMGSACYMAPEQVRGEAVTPQADVWSLGVVLYEALTGEVPFRDRTIDALFARILAASDSPTLPAIIPEPLQALVTACLQPDPARRPSDADVFVARLDAACGPALAGALKTTIIIDGLTVELDGLRPPALGDVIDQQRFRQHVMKAVLACFRPGQCPPELTAQLLALDELERRREATAAESAQAARRADASALRLAASRSRLEHAEREVRTEHAALSARHLQGTQRLMRLADDLGDAMAAYLDAYRGVTEAQVRHVRPSAAFAFVYDEQVEAALRQLDAAFSAWSAASAGQAELRDALREEAGSLTNLELQLIELRRSLLALESQRKQGHAQLEADARRAEDALVHQERAFEHALLKLGVGLYRALERVAARGRS